MPSESPFGTRARPNVTPWRRSRQRSFGRATWEHRTFAVSRRCVRPGAPGPVPSESAREGGGDSAVDGKGGASRRGLVGGEEDHRTADVGAGDLGMQQVPFAVDLMQLLRRNA